MKPSLQLKLSQHLALTPQLQQSIRLLQLSTLELEQELEKYLQENPLLERDEDDYASRQTPGNEGNEGGEAAAPEETSESSAPASSTPRSPQHCGASASARRC